MKFLKQMSTPYKPKFNTKVSRYIGYNNLITKYRRKNSFKTN